MAEVGSCKPVQELFQNGDELPERYLWKNSSSKYGSVDLTAPLATQFPVIDVSKLASSSSAELDKLRTALSSWGCFQAVNHGMEDSFLDKVRQLSREFFYMPTVEKQKHARETGEVEGYGNDKVLFENQPLDWTDRLFLLVSPEDKHRLKYWPENPKSFRSMVYEYTAGMKQIQEVLLKSMAKSLYLPENYFLDQFGERPIMNARFNYYPPCSRPDQVLGLKPHGDASGITILLQDKEVEGLQVLKDDQWFRVSIMPYAFVVNLGDQIEILSNGIFKSPIHRALTNSERERITLAMFYSPDPATEIGPLEELVDEKRPRLFKKVTNYLQTYFHHYQRAESAIDALRIQGTIADQGLHKKEETAMEETIQITESDAQPPQARAGEQGTGVSG